MRRETMREHFNTKGQTNVANQKRFYLLRLDDPDGKRPLGPYTKSEARLHQIANVGARIVTRAQLDAIRKRKDKPQ